MFKEQQASSEEAKRLRKLGGSWLAKQRRMADLTQREVALKLGVAYYTFISQLENGVGRVPPDLYIPYARTLGMPSAEFTKRVLMYYDPFTYQALWGAPSEEDFD